MAAAKKQKSPGGLRALVTHTLKSGNAGSELNWLFDTAGGFLIKKIDSINKKSQPSGALDCHKGCVHCCYQFSVDVTLLEAFRIADYIEEFFSDADKQVLMESLAAVQGKRAKLKQDRKPKEMFPCTLLLNNQCAVYAVRPFICRGVNSYDVKACEISKRSGWEKKIIPDYKPQKKEARRFLRTVSQSIAEAGLNGKLIDLTQALHIILNTPDARKLWLEGRPVHISS